MPEQPHPHPVSRVVVTPVVVVKPVVVEVPASSPHPFTPPVPNLTTRPVSRPEEGPRRGEGLAVIGSGLLVMALAALIAWVLYLAFA
jgi:hypothetical protein